MISYFVADRLALAMWLARDWAGTCEQLEALAEIATTFEIDKVPARRVQRPDGSTFLVVERDGLDLTARCGDVGLSDSAAAVLLSQYPLCPVPAELALRKVEFLRRVRGEGATP